MALVFVNWTFRVFLKRKKKKKRSNAEVGEDRRGRTTQNIKVKVNVGKIERGERRYFDTEKKEERN